MMQNWKLFYFIEEESSIVILVDHTGLDWCYLENGLEICPYSEKLISAWL